jgi:NitT/TauT family transport system ATP-binding protein
MHRIEVGSVSRLVGLLEILEDMGSTVDIAKLDDSLDEERTTLMNLLDDGESLQLITVTNGDVSLTETGRKLVNSNLEERKKMLKELIKGVEPFHSTIEFFKSSRTKSVLKEDLERFLSETFPTGDNEDILRTTLNWGRYTKLLSYDSDEGHVLLLD